MIRAFVQVGGASEAERTAALEFWARTLLAVNGAPAVSSSSSSAGGRMVALLSSHSQRSSSLGNLSAPSGSAPTAGSGGDEGSAHGSGSGAGDGTVVGSCAGVPQWWASRATLYALESLARAAFHAGLDHVFLDLLYPEYRVRYYTYTLLYFKVTSYSYSYIYAYAIKYCTPVSYMPYGSSVL